MQYRSITSLALVALATTGSAQRVFTRASQSVREFDIFGRQTDGYQPEDEICGGEGSTCADACGDGYLECASSDEAVHCYNPAQEESCCSSGNGSSCLASFYCARDPETETFCCPEGASLEECAVEFGVTGALVSDIPAPVTSSSAAPEPTSSEAASSSISISSVVVIVDATSSFEISSAIPTEISSSIFANSTSFEPSFTSTVTTTATSESSSAETSGSGSDGAEEEEGDDDSAAIARGPAMALVAAIAMLAALF